jgi:6-pyruvoyltetrahydropterin/6-carboxytetrahydropterin synthase
VITVSRRYKFSASHRLHVAEFDEARNDELFGKCNNPFGHGHNYEVEVSVEGAIDPNTGRAVNLFALDELVSRAVVQRYGHRYLNEELPEFERVVPTTENLGVAIRHQLQEQWPAAFPTGTPRLGRIRIFETERNIIEIAPAGASLQGTR